MEVISIMNRLIHRAEKYFSKNPHYNAVVHVLAGMSIGFFLTYPLAREHPLRWGLVFLALTLLGHLWAMR